MSRVSVFSQVQSDLNTLLNDSGNYPNLKDFKLVNDGYMHSNFYDMYLVIENEAYNPNFSNLNEDYYTFNVSILIVMNHNNQGSQRKLYGIIDDIIRGLESMEYYRNTIKNITYDTEIKDRNSVYNATITLDIPNK